MIVRVEVASADAGRGDAYEDLARTGDRNESLGETELAWCGGCRRKIVIREYSSGFPGPDVPDERVTWTVVEQGAFTYEMQCACGHYTVVSCFPRSTKKAPG